MPVYGSMSHDFTGRKIRKSAPKGEVYKKYTPPPSARNRASPNFRRDAEVHYASADIGSPSVCARPLIEKGVHGHTRKGYRYYAQESNAVPSY